MGNGQLALIQSRDVASLQGFLNKVSLVDFNPDLNMGPLQRGWLLFRGGHSIHDHNH